MQIPSYPQSFLSPGDVVNLVNLYVDKSPIPGVFNFRRLIKTRLAFANVRKGVSNAKIAFVGDSTMRGQGSAAGTAQALNGLTVQAAAILNSKTGLVCRGQNLWGSGNATLGSFDSRVTLSSWAPTGTLFGPGGPRLAASGAGTMLFAPTEATFDTCDVYYCNNAAGVFTVNFDAGATINTITETSAGTLAVQTNVGTLGTHTVNLPWVSGSPSIMALDCYNSAIKQVSFWNMGWLGATTNTWLTNNSKGWDPLTALASATLGQDCTVISLGINDYSGTPVAVDVPTYISNLTAIVNACKTNGGDVILLTPFPSDSTVAPIDVQASYTAACYTVSIATNSTLIDTTFLFDGARYASFYSDTKHLNGPGYSDVGAVVSRVLALAA